ASRYPSSGVASYDLMSTPHAHGRVQAFVRSNSVVPGQSSANVWPELVPDVPDEPAEESVADPADVLRPRRRARGKPGVRHEVAPDRSDVARPRRGHMAVAAMRDEHGLRRISGSRPDARAAGAKISGVFAPGRAQPGLDRIGHRHLSLARG